MKKNIDHIVLKKVSKIYDLKHGKSTLIESIFRRKKNEKYIALNNISLTIRAGERIGIVGVNGSGKTTLLKILAGITMPTMGTVTIKGKIVSLIDLSAGFHPDLSGEENISLNGMLLGMEKEEVNLLKDKIIEYAEIGSFIDSPLYTYSDGMKLRLGFSIAVNSNPDIMLMDECMAVGDKDFKIKAKKMFEDYTRQKKTFIIITHWLAFLEDFCDRVIWIEKGSIKMDGKTKKVIFEYLNYHGSKVDS